MSKLAEKYGWEVVFLGVCWIVESLLNIGQTLYGFFS